MIVRILGEGQYEVPAEALVRLEERDAALEAAIEAGDEAAFREALLLLLDGVRQVGVPRGPALLEESARILPRPDASLDDVRRLLGGETPPDEVATPAP